MFNKYWREYPWFFQLIQFVLLVFICVAFFSVMIAFVVPLMTNVQISEIQKIVYDSKPNVRIAFLLFQGFSQLFVFLIPCAMFAYAVHPRPLQYLGITQPANNAHWWIVLLIAISAIPVVSGIAGLFDQIPLTAKLEAKKATFATQQKAMLNLQTAGEFITAFIVMGIIAPIGEEFLFRGIMMKFAAKKMVGNIFWPILLTAVFFAMVHGNVVGFVSLVISGLILGYVYYFTGSLVLSMFTHFIVNGSQVLLMYFGRNNEAMTKMMETNETPWGIFIAGIAVFIFSFYLLWKNRTPLPVNWTTDFTQEELEQKVQDKNNPL